MWFEICGGFLVVFFLPIPNDGPNKYQRHHTSANRYCVHLGDFSKLYIESNYSLRYTHL